MTFSNNTTRQGALFRKIKSIYLHGGKQPETRKTLQNNDNWILAHLMDLASVFVSLYALGWYIMQMSCLANRGGAFQHLLDLVVSESRKKNID